MRRILFLLLILAAAGMLWVVCADSEPPPAPPPAPAPPPEPDLEVLVISTAGRPLAGVRVGVAPQAAIRDFRLVGGTLDLPAGGVEGVTDEAGRARFTGLGPGLWFAAGWRKHSQLDVVEKIAVPRPDEPAVLTMRVGGGLTVVAAGPFPAGLTASVVKHEFIAGEFDATGRCRIEGIVPGDIRVLVDGPGWQIERDRILQAGTRRPLIVHPPVGGPATLTGRIWREEWFLPLRHLQVVFERKGETIRLRGQADEEGRFRLEGLPVGRADIQVGRGNELPTRRTWRQPVHLQPGPNVLRAEVREARIRLLFRDRDTGRLVGATVYRDGAYQGSVRRGDGLFVIENLRPVWHEIRVVKHGYGPRWLKIFASPESPVRTVVLTPTEPLWFEVRDDQGRPVPWIKASITDETGHDIAWVGTTWKRAKPEEGLHGFNLPPGTFDVVVYDRADRWWKGRITAPVPGGRKEIVLRKE